MKKKKMLLIINPKSGKNQIKPNLCDIIDLYVSNGYIVTVHTTRYARDARQIAKKMAKDYDIIVCAGGDGTLDEVCSGLLDSESNTVLGYIPAGTTNDFAKSLGITSKVMNAAQTVLTGTPFACDLGEFNGTPFIYVAAFGAFSAGVLFDTAVDEKYDGAYSVCYRRHKKPGQYKAVSCCL